MKENTFFKLLIILLIALVLRLWGIDKPEGLWNDEYVSWQIASSQNISEFFSKMLLNCHMPLYYLYLKLWMFLFGDLDISLRISSLVPSVIAVVSVFYAGKEFKNDKFGLFCAFLTAISSFCIYFAQEARLYSLLFLFSSLILVYFIKIIKNLSKLDLIFYFVFNLLLCLTHTLGIIYSFFNILILLKCLYKKNNNYKKNSSIFLVLKYSAPFILILICFIPFLYNIAFSNSLSQFWSQFSLSKVIFTFSDYFSPVQINIINSPKSFFNYIFHDNLINYIYIIFGIIPFLLGIFGIINAIKQKNIIINSLLISSGLFFISLICFSLAGKLILITKYSIEIYPVLILAMAFGFISISNKKIKYFVVLLFLGLNIFYLAVSNDSAPLKSRPEGNLAVIELIKHSRLKNSDYVVLTYYGKDRFQKYLKNDDKYKISSINKFNFNKIMFNNPDYKETIKNGKNLYRNYFKKFPNEEIIKYSNINYIENMKKGDRIGLVFLDSVSFFPQNKIIETANSEKEYKNAPFIFLSFSSLKNNLMYSFKDCCKIDSITGAGDWTLIVYEKIN